MVLDDREGVLPDREVRTIVLGTKQVVSQIRWARCTNLELRDITLWKPTVAEIVGGLLDLCNVSLADGVGRVRDCGLGG